MREWYRSWTVILPWTEFTVITAKRLALYPSSGIDSYPWPPEEGGMLIPHFPGEDQQLQRREYLTSHTSPRLKSRELLGSSAAPASTGCLLISVEVPPTHRSRVNKMSQSGQLWSVLSCRLLLLWPAGRSSLPFCFTTCSMTLGNLNT